MDRVLSGKGCVFPPTAFILSSVDNFGMSRIPFGFLFSASCLPSAGLRAVAVERNWYNLEVFVEEREIEKLYYCRI